MDTLIRDLLKKGYLDIELLKTLLEKSKNETRISSIELIYKNDLISKENLIKHIATEILNKNYEISIIIKIPFISKTEVLEEISEQLYIPFFDLNQLDFNYSLAKKFPLWFLKNNFVMPIREDNFNFFVAFSDPIAEDFDKKQKEVQKNYSGKQLQAVISSEEQIKEHIQKLEFENQLNRITKNILDKLANDTIERESSAIVDLINVILETSIKIKSSDIHIEPTESSCIVRSRIDGKLHQMFKFEKNIYPPLSSRIKLMGNMDIAEKRIPQDGRFSKEFFFNKSSVSYDFRVSTLPIVDGESIVIRILDKNGNLLDLKSIGMAQYNFKKLVKVLNSPHGIILVTGPTGSGKTTTLYGSLNQIKSVQEKIITIEDPIEYKINLVSQVQVNRKAGLDFHSTLKAVLRQDPDKIMIGEIRDRETLKIAVQSALTGHLVLSTLHTNDAVSSVSRMVDIGIESYLLGSAIVGIVAQRLVRKLCHHCKTEINKTETELNSIIIEKNLNIKIDENDKLFKGQGCSHCAYTGFAGREVICEVLLIDDELESLISRNASRQEIFKKAREKGFKTMIETGIMKALKGITTLDEVLKVT